MYFLLIALGFIFYLPKILYRYITEKGYRYPFSEKLGIKIPSCLHKKKVYWFHANSLGETKSGLIFAEFVKKKEPTATIVFSSVTETGKKEAEKSTLVDLSFYMPLDFSCIMKRLFRVIRPQIIFIIETDFWYQFFKRAKKEKCKLVVVSGKISSKSVHRLLWIKFFAKKMFSYVDLFCMQNDCYKQSLEQLGIPKEKIFVTGNLKFARVSTFLKEKELKEWKKKFHIKEQEKILVLASTHDKEEKLILKKLQNIPYKIFLAPRHPQRFLIVKNILQKQGVRFSCYSEKISKSSSVILIDTMGILSQLYQICDVAILGGSFIPSVGGHNILEPMLYQKPVIFGPYMHNQQDLVQYALKTSIAKQTTLENLRKEIDTICSLSFPKVFSQNITEKTWECIKRKIGGC